MASPLLFLQVPLTCAPMGVPTPAPPLFFRELTMKLDIATKLVISLSLLVLHILIEGIPRDTDRSAVNDASHPTPLDLTINIRPVPLREGSNLTLSQRSYEL